MSKRTISQIMLALLLTGMLTVTFSIQPAKTEPDTIIVPDDYSTIQEAVNNANVGDTVFVRNGTYHENVIINKSLTLVGESKDAIISQNYSYVTLEISENDVIVEGFTILNYFEVYEPPPMPCCIFLNSSSDCLIRDNEFGADFPSYGLAISGGSRNRIEKNTVQTGIFVYGGSENRIEENVVNDVGIYISGSTSNVIIKNTVYSQYYPLELISSNYNYILYNWLCPVSFTQVHVSMYYSNNNTIEGNTMVPGYEEISRMEFYLSCNNSIFHNNFNGDRGVEMLVDEDSEHNVWDDGYPSGGNYWSDYTGTDGNGDGIGDTPYVIDESNQDNYPLMKAWSAKVQNLNTGLCYTTIQEAINHANEGDTIFVRNGTYYENVVVNKTISLIGENRDATAISGHAPAVTLRISVDNVTISGFTITHCGIYRGLHLVSANNCLITNNIVENNLDGILLGHSSNNNTISNNLVRNNVYDGIYLLNSSSNNVIVGNSISGQGLYGIFVHLLSNNNSITQNNITQNLYGIVIDSSSYNVIHRNRITQHTNYTGIWITSNSCENRILENNIENNGVGVHIQWSRGLNDIFCHNNFINNLYQAAPYDFGSIWDNGCEGNYWSDYNGTDSDGDGIGDTPYTIDEDHQDNYPLMNPYWNPADVDHDLDVDLYDAVKLLTAYGYEIGEEGYNCHCDIAEPYEVINLYDAVKLLTSYGKKDP